MLQGVSGTETFSGEWEEWDYEWDGLLLQDRLGEPFVRHRPADPEGELLDEQWTALARPTSVQENC